MISVNTAKRRWQAFKLKSASLSLTAEYEIGDQFNYAFVAYCKSKSCYTFGIYDALNDVATSQDFNFRKQADLAFVELINQVWQDDESIRLSVQSSFIISK